MADAAPKTDNGVFISTSDHVCLDFERHVKERPSECWAMLLYAAFPQGEKYEIHIGFPLVGRAAEEGSYDGGLLRLVLSFCAIYHQDFELEKREKFREITVTCSCNQD